MKMVDCSGRYKLPLGVEEKDFPYNTPTDKLVSWYNENSGSTQIRKFSNRATAVSFCAKLKKALDEMSSRIVSFTTQHQTQQQQKENTTMSKKSKTAKGKSVKAKKSTGAKGGRKFALLDHTIHKLVDKNPRREGTEGFKTWQAIKSGMTYRSAIDAGARNKDIRHDVNQGNLELRAPKSKAAAPKAKAKKTAVKVSTKVETPAAA